MKLQDDSFPQRWELRNSKVDGDTDASSDDDDDDQQAGSNPKGNQTDSALVTADLVLYENHQPPPAAKQKKKKKKKVVQKRETNKKRKHDGRSFNDKACMFKDLKIFADSLIHELAAARETMFAHMRDEMNNMKKNVVRAELQKLVRLPCSIPSSQLENRIHLVSDYGGVGSGRDICRLMGFPRRLAELQAQEQMGGGFGVKKNWDLYGEGRSYTYTSHIPIPVHHNFLNMGGRFASMGGTSLGDHIFLNAIDKSDEELHINKS